jgi:hypothetical protein
VFFFKDVEFNNWEQSFDAWNQSFSNHPDQTMFKQYERQFLDVRDKLLEKRKAIYAPANDLINSANFLLSKFSSPTQGFASFNNNLSLSQNPQPYGNANSRGSMSFSLTNRERPMNDYRSDFNRPRIDHRQRSQDRTSRGYQGSAQRHQRSDQRVDSSSNKRPHRENSTKNDRRNNQREKNPKRLKSSFDSRKTTTLHGDKNKRLNLKKPSQREIESELKRKDVYPFIPW